MARNLTNPNFNVTSANALGTLLQIVRVSMHKLAAARMKGKLISRLYMTILYYIIYDTMPQIAERNKRNLRKNEKWLEILMKKMRQKMKNLVKPTHMGIFRPYYGGGRRESLRHKSDKGKRENQFTWNKEH